MTRSNPHIVLLGDSIFDNAAYTSGAPDVITHLRRVLPRPWRATLLAVDGATAARIAEQLRKLPGDATHLVISVGGNDALMEFDLLAMPVASGAEALAVFADRVASFERVYRSAITSAVARELPVTVCTIYNGLLGRDVEAAARMGVAIFNDVILRTAVDLHLDVIELRAVCTQPRDYANPIEPSSEGGLKIARAIASAVGAIDAPARPGRVWREH